MNILFLSTLSSVAYNFAPFERVESASNVEQDEDAVRLLFCVLHVFDLLEAVLSIAAKLLCLQIGLKLQIVGVCSLLFEPQGLLSKL